MNDAQAGLKAFAETLVKRHNSALKSRFPNVKDACGCVDCHSAEEALKPFKPDVDNGACPTDCTFLGDEFCIVHRRRGKQAQ